MHGLFDNLAGFSSEYMMPLMVAVFGVAIFFRLCVYYIIKSEQYFTKEFESRVLRHMVKEYKSSETWKFQKVLDFLLKKTFHETYVLRIASQETNGLLSRFFVLIDRLFKVERGANRVIEDTLQQTQFFREGNDPNFDMGLNFVFSSNPYFNRLFQILPIGMVDDLLKILPGLFIIGGLFGTFLGIMGGIPALQNVNVSDIQQTSETLSTFLKNMGFAMGTSVLGIMLSVMFRVFNTVFSLRSLYIDLIERYKNSILFLWQEANKVHERNNASAKRFKAHAGKNSPVLTEDDHQASA